MDAGFGSIKLADVTGDGSLEVLGLTAASDITKIPSLYVFRQTDKGSLTQPDVYALAGRLSPFFTPAEVDGDGITDVVVGTETTIELLRGTPSGLAAPTIVAHVRDANALQAGDVDGDGQDDLVVRSPGGLSWLRNIGGAFSPPMAFLVDVPAGFSVADLDGDGIHDVIAAHDDGISISSGTTTGPQTTTSRMQIGTKYVGVMAVDVTGDGRRDVVARRWRGPSHDASMALKPRFDVLRQGKNGRLRDPVSSRPQQAPARTTAAPLDQEDRENVLVTHDFPDRVTVMRNGSSGRLMPTVTVRLDPGSVDFSHRGSVAGGDVSGDGIPDIVVAMAHPGGIMVLRGRPMPVTLIDRRTGEHSPAIQRGTTAWSETARHRPKRSTAYVRYEGKKIRLNRRGTDGWAGGIEGDRVLYEEIAHGGANIKVYNVATGKRKAFPRKVNSPHWEWRPTVSDGTMLFGRIHRYEPLSEILIYRRGRVKRLDQMSTTQGFLSPGQVKGRWAVWESCLYGDCDVIRYDLRKKTREQLMTPSEAAEGLSYNGYPLQYAPSVAADGTVYFARSGPARCGQAVRLIEAPIDAPSRTIAKLPEGSDVLFTYVGPGRDGTPTFVFDRVRCRKWAWGTFRVPLQ